MIDGTFIEVQLIQQEHPIAFNPWPHRLFIGGYLNEDNTPTCVFRGSLLELRFWRFVNSNEGIEMTPVVRWPLIVDTNKNALQETIRASVHDVNQTLLNLQAT